MSAFDISVVLPTLNEAANLEVLIPRVKAVFAKLGVRGEVLVVDGGSKDATVAVAERLGARVMRQKGRGYGSALREGLEAAAAPYASVFDADGSHPPELLAELWPRREEADLVVGSRYVPGGSAAMPLARQFLSRLLNRVTMRVLGLGVMDSSSGLRLYRRELLKALGSKATDFTVQQDLLVRLIDRGARVLEVPFRYEPRLEGASKASALKLAPAYLRMFARLKPLRGGWGQEAGLVGALTVGLATGLWGISGGLPGPARLRALPESARTSPDFAPNLAASWKKLYEEIRRAHAEVRAEEPVVDARGLVKIPAGWTFPPDPLLNSARSLLTQSVHPDEKKVFIILSQMRPWRFEFEPLYVQYGGAFVYPLGAFLAGAKLVGLARLVPDLAHYLAHPEDMARLYLLGRLFVLLFHLGTILIVHEIGRTLSGYRTGTLAALLYALCPLVLSESHLAKPHPVSAFWMCAAAWAMIRAIEKGRPADFVACGLAAGLAAGAAPTAAYGALAPLLARFLRREGSWKPALWGAFAAPAAFLATNPHLLLSPRAFIWELTVYMPGRFGASWSGLLASVDSMSRGLGLLLAPAAAAAVARALLVGDARRRALAILVLVGWLTVWLRFHNWTGWVSTLRVLLPMIGLACVLVADAAAAVPARGWAALLAALLLADTGLRGSVVLSDLGGEASGASTRERAADWVDANIPPKSVVGLLRYPEPAHTPPFRWDRVALSVFDKPEALGADIPEWLVGSEDGLKNLGAWAEERYETAAAFPSARLLGARSEDDSLFADSGMLVLRRREGKR